MNKPLTPAEHYLAAEAALDKANVAKEGMIITQLLLARAQVHATLATIEIGTWDYAQELYRRAGA